MYCESTPQDFCAGQTCSGAGTCSSTTSGYTCSCDSGFNGVDCANSRFLKY